MTKAGFGLRRNRIIGIKNKSGADAIREGAPAAVVAAIGVDTPGVVGVAGERGAQPPVGGRPVQFRNSLVAGGAAGAGLEVGQLGAIIREIQAVTGGEAHLTAGQQEDFAGQAVSTTTNFTTSSTNAIRNFDCHNIVLYIFIV